MSDDKPTGGPDDSAKPNPEDAKAPKLADLLNEWEKGEENLKAEAKPKVVDTEARLTALEADNQLLAEDANQREISSTIELLKGDLKVDDAYVDYWVNKRATDDPRLRDIFETRLSNPAAWKTVVKALVPEFKEHAKTVFHIKDDKASSLGAAVRAAKVAGGDAAIETDVGYGSLSDADFAVKKAEIFRLAESGQLK